MDLDRDFCTIKSGEISPHSHRSNGSEQTSYDPITKTILHSLIEQSDHTLRLIT